MQALALKFDRKVLESTFFDHCFLLAYNGFRSVRVMTHDRPAKPVGLGDDHRHDLNKQDWTLDEVVMPFKAIVRYGDAFDWEEPPLSPLETAISPYVSFEREVTKGPGVRRGNGLYWQSWLHAPLYHRGGFVAFKEAVVNLEGLANAILASR